MKFNSFFILVTFVLFTIPSIAQKTYFIKYKSSVPVYSIDEKLKQQKFSKVAESKSTSLPKFNIEHFAKGIGKKDEELNRIIKVSFSNDVDETSLIQILSSDPEIEFVQKSTTYKLDIIPNDSLISEQWALNKIKAFDAWNITGGSDTVILGIIDTGIDYDHPDLKNQIFINQGEIGIDINGKDKRSNGIDDDGNGFVDDYRGWDFTDRAGFPFDSTGGDYLNWDNNPYDDQGHGTYISGITAAQTNNLIGIAGVAPKIKILNLRAFDPGGFGEEDDVAAAILYAVKMGCKVINMSFGDDAFSYVLRDVIRYAYSQNVVLVASAGNSGSDTPHYPSGYSEVICVGNSTEQDYVAGSSNFGSTIDLVAPGSSIITTAKNFSYASISGTSASAPFVSAAAALILSLQNFTNEEVKQIIKSTTDDIDEAGWDLRSGAGRLNLFKALTVTAPSAIKFYTPTQDFATSENNLPIRVSVLSPYFINFSLQVGTGLNPTKWTFLIENKLNQIYNEEVYNLNVTGYADTVYSLRLIINQSNGRTLEERVNFHIDRTPPVAELISLTPSFYGDKSTPLAAVYTNEPSIVRMYYRSASETDFKFITLDGFTINNQFVKTIHYGFIPRDLVLQNSVYEIYFEAINLVGLKSEIKNNGNNFFVPTEFNADFAKENVLPYTLPTGSLFEKPLNISSFNQFSDLVLRTNSNPKISKIFHFDNQSFTQIDSLQNEIIKDFGDFNHNGFVDLLTYFVRDGYIDEQSSQNSSSFIQKYSNTGSKFWPILARDVDSNGTFEIFSIQSDTVVDVWKVQSDLNLNKAASLKNFTPSGLGQNILNSPNAAIADIDGDGVKEFWMVDEDGDLFSYKINGNNSFTQQYFIPTKFLGSSSYLTSGDYDGDGKDEIAVLLHSIENNDISPFYRLVIFNLSNSNLNMLFDKSFIDASTEFNNTFRKAENSIRFYDIDNDNKDELILFLFPYSYIFKKDVTDKIISYKENINSNSIFIGDLNNNGVPEIAFPYSNNISFSEFTISGNEGTPYNLSGFSLGNNCIELNWIGDGTLFYIYKGLDKNNLSLIDSTIQKNYLDLNIELNKNYYYAVKSFNTSNGGSLSALSKIIGVYSHEPARPDTAVSNSKQSIIVSFSEKIKNTIDNLQSFEVIGSGYPNSISPNDQYSYLLSFNKELPNGVSFLIIKDLRDFYNSPIIADTLNFIVSPKPANQEFFISSFEVLDAYKIKIQFNINVDASSAIKTDNYIFNPDNKVTSVSIDPNDSKTLYLDLRNQKPIGSIGKEYVLRISNIRSDLASGNLPITAGAGSYIVLSSFAKDLSDVYVYPNPTKAGTEKITFANLPQRAKITIWSVDGNLVNEVEETDGNGGVDFDLRDNQGKNLASGIYFYRIVQLDEQSNEGEEKLGKFAVIR